MKPHQLALIHKMLELENPDLKSLTSSSDDTSYFRSDFGAISGALKATALFLMKDLRVAILELN